MAMISDKLNKILSAVFGKDVRQALYDGLNAVNKEAENTTAKQQHLEDTFNQLVINAGSSNAEIVDARVDKNNGNKFEKIGDRLDAHSVQLAEKTKLIQDNIKTVQLVGHRGAMKFAPENTMASFRIAQQLGFKAIEVDLQLTSDNEYVIYHDDTLDTLTNGTGTISSKTLADINILIYTKGSNVSKFNDEKIPTLKEFLAFCKGYGIVPFLEFKCNPNDGNMKNLVDIVELYGFKTSAVYFGYNIANLELLRKYSPNSRVLLSMNEYDTDRIRWVKGLGGKVGVVPYMKAITTEHIKLMVEQGLDVCPYDVKSYEEYYKCAINGCSGALIDNICGGDLNASKVI